MNEKPIIAFTMGDAAGIGPELILKVLSDPTIWDICQPLVVADFVVMEQMKAVVQADLVLERVDAPCEMGHQYPFVCVLQPDAVDLGPSVWGKLNPANGQAAADCMGVAIDMAVQGEVQGIVLAPMNKEAFHLAGYDYSDELVWLAERTGATDAVMMGVMGREGGSRGVWTIAVVEHFAFGQILEIMQTERILRYTGYLHLVLTRLDPTKARIAVSALNVHAGEGGLYGREEIERITPAIVAAQEQGMDVTGPIPADMVFAQALAGRYDGVVAMHHDQANIARKLQPMSESATIFFGLPVFCGTTAHGTAFDVAGQGIADPGSLIASTRMVARLAASA